METDELAIKFPLGAKVITPTGLIASIVEHDTIAHGQLAGKLWAIVIQVETHDRVIHRMVYDRQLLREGHLRNYVAGKRQRKD